MGIFINQEVRLAKIDVQEVISFYVCHSVPKCPVTAQKRKHSFPFKTLFPVALLQNPQPPPPPIAALAIHGRSILWLPNNETPERRWTRRWIQRWPRRWIQRWPRRWRSRQRWFWSRRRWFWSRRRWFWSRRRISRRRTTLRSRRLILLPLWDLRNVSISMFSVGYFTNSVWRLKKKCALWCLLLMPLFGFWVLIICEEIT